MCNNLHTAHIVFTILLITIAAGAACACTTAVISGAASPSGRPLLWKNRDRSVEDQEIVYFTDGLYPYITITNAGDSTQAWGGANTAGFAIEDANNWNTPDIVTGENDDGWIIKLALQTCVTIDDFQEILDSTSIVGHTEPANFGVIDAFGGAAMFETFAYSYIRYDADDPEVAPEGVLVRSNWSYAGSSSGRLGVYRHDRAQEFILSAVANETLDLQYMTQTVLRDLRRNDSFDPYPIPTQPQYGSLPEGWISTYGATCRRLTVSALIVEGILPGEDPLLTTCWIVPMAAQYGVTIPFWVAAGTTPGFVNGEITAPLCDEGLRIKAFAQHASGFHDTLDTYILNDGLGGGLHATTWPLENYVFARTYDSLANWRAQNIAPSADMAALTNALCDTVYEILSAWPGPGASYLPPLPVTDLTLIPAGLNLELSWSPVTVNTHDLPVTPDYSVWRFENGSAPGEEIYLGTTSELFFTVPILSQPDCAFFMVRAEL